ncbi:hypothetical protein EVC12_224 [Rhizobium phage RHph_I42]|nr:hypothetical protein EVC12_224 [Rhizobium phage RHph_I42]
MYDFSPFEQEVIPQEELGTRLAVLEYTQHIGFIVVADKSAIVSYFAGLTLTNYLVKDSGMLNSLVDGTYYGVPFVAQENDGKFTLVTIPKGSSLYQKLTNGIDKRGLQRDPADDAVEAAIAKANESAADE